MHTVFLNVNVTSSSMEPTLMVNDKLLCWRGFYQYHDVKRYDIVVFRHSSAGTLYVKRVIGLPNDTIVIKDGKVYVNNENIPLNDDFCTVDDSNFGPIKIPDGSVFVLGDNRYNSDDSRVWKNPFVKVDDIVAKVFLKYQPTIKVLS